MYILLSITHFDANGNYHMTADTDLPDNQTVLKVLKDTVKTMEMTDPENTEDSSTYVRTDL